jgi:NAD(P)-dependent dehydrogenase (short-subunit alcohol dehydrogenase family)
VSEPELVGQTVVVIGGSAGIGLETARRARAEGADVILAGRNPERLERAAGEVGARSTATFDANDSAALQTFFDGLEGPIDHVMVTVGVARHATGKVRPGGTLIFMGGTGGRHPARGIGLLSAMTDALPALTASMALEIAPVRVNLIAAGFVDTPLSASLLGDDLQARRDELSARLPIGRVVGPDDVAALAVHIMVNTALTGATFDIDGGQGLLAG